MEMGKSSNLIMDWIYFLMRPIRRIDQFGESNIFEESKLRTLRDSLSQLKNLNSVENLKIRLPENLFSEIGDFCGINDFEEL